ncbi:MAG: hypothetical protein ACK5LP_07885 [Campylobacteraceae bacterium]
MFEKILGIVFVILGLLTIFSSKFRNDILNFNSENGLMFISVGLILIIVGGIFFKKSY